MIDLQTIKQGTLETLTITWELNSLTTVPASISGAVITAVMYNVDTGATTAVTGTLTATGASTFTWKLSAGDSGTAGSYLVTFKAVVSGETAYTLNAALNVQGNPAVDAVQNDPLVGVSVAESTWVTAGSTAVPDGADLVDANNLSVAAYTATGIHYDIRDYGAAVDGTTDDSAAVIAAIAAAAAANGGSVFFPAGVTRIDSQIVLPNDGVVVTPNQPSIRLTGTTSYAHGQSTTALNGGSILDLRFAGADAKILTLGFGLLEIDRLTLTDKSSPSSDTPFILTTNTTLKIHHCAFYGSIDKSYNNCDQDAIYLGGVGVGSPPVHDDQPTAPFQGYGTVIESNFFDRIRTLCKYNTYCANTSFVNNTSWQHGGSDADHAALMFSGLNNISGNYIAGNLIEMNCRHYAVLIANSNNNLFIGNSFTDGVLNANAVTNYKINSGNSNLIIGGYTSQTYPMFIDAAPSPSTIYINSETGGGAGQLYTTWHTPVDFKNQLRVINSGYGPRVIASSGDEWRRYSTGTGQYDIQYVPSGGSMEAASKIRRMSASNYKHFFYGDVINISTTKTPASATATGTAGDIAWDSSYLYICTATNTWTRTPLAWATTSPTQPARLLNHAQLTFGAAGVIGTGTASTVVGSYFDLRTGATVGSAVRYRIANDNIAAGNQTLSFLNWAQRVEFSAQIKYVSGATGSTFRAIYGKTQAAAWGKDTSGDYVGVTIANGTITEGFVCKAGVVTDVSFGAGVAYSGATGLEFYIVSGNGTVSFYVNGALRGSTTAGPIASSIGTINFEFESTNANGIVQFWSQSNGY